jgi:stage III sporulation protein AB
MLSVIAGALIFAALTYSGFIVKGQYSARLDTLQHLHDFVIYMSREVSLYKTPVTNVIANYLSLKPGKKDNLLIKFIELKIRDYPSIYKLSDYVYLKKNDRRIITELFMNLGRGDYREEQKNLERFTLELETIRQDAFSMKDREGRLYQRLLSLLGFALMIIVV